MATSYLSPGVYVEEVDRGSKPIEAVGTNTVGFLGESAKGPLNESVLITNWSQFVKTFGDFKDCSEHLAHGVYGFFNNGGSRCFVVNVGAPEQAQLPQRLGHAVYILGFVNVLFRHLVIFFLSFSHSLLVIRDTTSCLLVTSQFPFGTCKARRRKLK
jgi:hypothetical protein